MMATRTVVKTRTKTKVREGEEQLRSSQDEGSREEMSSVGQKRLVQLKAGPGRSLNSTPLDSSFDLSSSSDEDDFADDIRADIQRELDNREEKRKNGGRSPRKKKQKESKADKQTQHTRKLLAKGQPREQKTAKWAIRERQVNPLIKLLNIEFTISVSDSDSSSVSEEADGSDTTKAYRAHSMRHRKRTFNQQYGFKADPQQESGSAIKATSEYDIAPLVTDRKGKGRPPSVSQAAFEGTDDSATEDSDNNVGTNGARSGGQIATFRVAEKRSFTGQNVVEDSESDMSEDISPLADPGAYAAQIARRTAKRSSAKRDHKDSSTKSKGDSIEASGRVWTGVQGHGAEKDIGTVRDRNLYASLQDEDSDAIPDCSVNDPRYLSWTQRQVTKRSVTSLQGSRGHEGFRPFQQRASKPHFDVKSQQQASCGPLVLGFDNDGHSIEIPATINRFLRGYQRDGARFFWSHYQKGEGGLLGDDMGLGKTIQVIAFLAAIMRHRCTEEENGRRLDYLSRVDNAAIFKKPTDLGATALVIAPASVVENWARELDTWTYLSVAIYRPNSEQKNEVLKDFRRGRTDVVICGIDAARNHIEELMDLDFSCIFVDEVHKVKNPASRTSKALQQFACKRRFGLTGTAMQNRYSELHTVLDWCFPGRLGDRNQWRDYVEAPLKEAQRKDATQQQLAIGRARAFALVHYLLPHFFLRRTKELIADQLPKKTDNIVFCPLTEEQKMAYKQLLAHDEVQKILTHDEPCPCGKTDEQGLPYARGKCCDRDWATLLLKWITVFMKVANHAVLIYPSNQDKRDNPEKFAQDQELTRWAYQGTYRDRIGDLTANRTTDTDKRLCGKWPILRDFLNTWKANGDKVLLFSRSTRLLDALQWWIETANYNMVRLDGSTPTERRLHLCDQFNDPQGGQFIFLISTLAGGVGLNLTSANRVVIFDPNWNPVSDLQAMDRSYRWGQTRDVSVYRLVGAGSIEELIYTRQIYKQHQAEIAYSAANPSRLFVGVQDDKRNQGELFGVKNLFRFTETSNRTKRSVEQAHISELGFELMNYASQKSKKRKRITDGGESSDQDVDGKQDDQAVLDVLIGEKKAEDLRADAEDDEIARILRDNGVTYTHNHSDLVKSSKIEARISKAALKDFQDASFRGRVSNQRTTRAKPRVEVKTTASWAPSKGTKERKTNEPEASPDSNPFKLLFDGDQVSEEILAELAEALDFDSAASMARKFAGMNGTEQVAFMARAKQIVERI